MYDYIRTGKTESDLTLKINEAVEKGRKNETWRAQYMRELAVLQDARDEGIEIGREEGREEGRAEGRKEGKAEGREEELNNRVQYMLEKGKTVEEIVEFGGYSEDIVRKIERKMKEDVSIRSEKDVMRS